MASHQPVQGPCAPPGLASPDHSGGEATKGRGSRPALRSHQSWSRSLRSLRAPRSPGRRVGFLTALRPPSALRGVLSGSASLTSLASCDSSRGRSFCIAGSGRREGANRGAGAAWIGLAARHAAGAESRPAPGLNGRPPRRRPRALRHRRAGGSGAPPPRPVRCLHRRGACARVAGRPPGRRACRRARTATRCPLPASPRAPPPPPAPPARCNRGLRPADMRAGACGRHAPGPLPARGPRVGRRFPGGRRRARRRRRRRP